jgi:hypothetical protein
MEKTESLEFIQEYRGFEIYKEPTRSRYWGFQKVVVFSGDLFSVDPVVMLSMIDYLYASQEAGETMTFSELKHHIRENFAPLAMEIHAS